jgi:hypothetical protein
VADITSHGSDSEIAARLLDVDPSTDTETLVARGLWRPAISNQAQQVFQLHPNGYRFAPGHLVKLELLSTDDPYGRTSNNQTDLRVGNLELRLPVVEPPGALGGLVQTPAAKILPPGYTLARDFAPARYSRPRGAAHVQVALVPAFRQCTKGNRYHGAPLAFSSCAPPVQASPNLTVGTPDANGLFAYSTGSTAFDVVPDDPLTSADESDVAISTTMTDVRRATNLSDYTGQLQDNVTLRITDVSNGDAATIIDTPLRAPVPCAANSLPDQGATCSVITSVNAISPGAVTGGARAVWELGTVQLYDGGPDGIASTADNSLFARQGVFTP